MKTKTKEIHIFKIKDYPLKDKNAAALETELFHNGSVRRCARCGKPFAAGGNRAKYCNGCKIIVKKKQQAEYARRKRAESRKIEI